jgi:ribonuclease HI
MYFDGSLNLEDAGAGVLLISPTGEQLKYVLQIFWKVPNNEVEYEALLHGLRLAASLGITRLLVYGDSAVGINQVNKSWDRNKENMDAYFLEVRKLENKFYGLEFHHVVRDNNVATDVMSKLGSTCDQVQAGVFVHELHAPSIPEPAPPTTVPAHPPAGQEVMMIDVDWRQPFIDYLSEQKVPSDKNLAEQLIRRAKSYVLVGDKLYRRGASSGVLMKCVPRQEGKDISHAGQQGLPTSFLLANSSRRRRRTRQKVPRVPILLQAATCPSLQASHHTANLAFCLLGARHDWATPNCARWIQQSTGGHGQVHQVDRGQAGYIPQG